MKKLLRFSGVAISLVFGQQTSHSSHHMPPMPDQPSFPPSWEVHITRTRPAAPVNSQVETAQYWALYGYRLKQIVSLAWAKRYNRIFLDSGLDSNALYDVALVPPHELKEEDRFKLVRAALEKDLHVRIVKEKRSLEVDVLSAPNGKGPDLHELAEGWIPPGVGAVSGSALGGSNRDLNGSNIVMDDLCELTEQFENTLVVDETNLRGHYSIQVKGDGDYRKMLKERLGLVLTRGKREIDVLRVEPR